jgi:hypothetical protein
MNVPTRIQVPVPRACARADNSQIMNKKVLEDESPARRAWSRLIALGLYGASRAVTREVHARHWGVLFILVSATTCAKVEWNTGETRTELDDMNQSKA